MSFNQQILKLFSKVFYIKKLNFDTKKYVSFLKNFDFVEAGWDKNTDVGNISSASKTLKVLDNENFLDLKLLIMQEFDFFKNNYLRYNNNFTITNSWVSKSVKNQSSNYHAHKNSFYSGVIYLQTDEKCGGISFENFYNTNSFMLIPEEYNDYNSNEYTIGIQEGLIIFFPSEIHHKILKNNSDIERYAIAFNLMPTGKIGTGDSSMYISI